MHRVGVTWWCNKNNGAKERCGSIVTETIRNRVLITIDTPKEWNLMLIQNTKNSSYLMFSIRSYEPEKIYPIFFKGGKYPRNIKWTQWKWCHQIQHTREPYCRGFKLLCTKCGILYFCRKKDQECVLINFIFCLPKGWCYQTSGRKRSAEG